MPENKIYQEVVSALTAHPAVQAGAMFGMPVLRVGGKAFAGPWKNALAVKVGQDRVQALLNARQGKPFNPGMGPMKEWVLVSAPKTGAKKKWLALADEARKFVESRL